MSFKKSLTSLILAGATSLSAVGCTKNVDHSQYAFKGEIGDVKLEFKEDTDTFYSHNILKAERWLSEKTEYEHKSIHRSIVYQDLNDDLKIEQISIRDFILDESKRNDRGYSITKEYSLNDPVGKPIVEQAQQQFDAYLKQILQVKKEEQEKEKKEGLELIK